MILKAVTINKYKCIEQTQTFEVEKDITILVGMNESGKTSILEALAKTNYFQNDKAFKFNLTHDYPRKEKKKIEKSGVDPESVVCTFIISDKILARIVEDLGKNVLKDTLVTTTVTFSNKRSWNIIQCDVLKFIEQKTQQLGISSKALNDKIATIKNNEDLESIIIEYKDEKIINGLKTFQKYFANKWDWESPIAEYITRIYLQPNLPKYLYYDEYYSLPSRINIENLQTEDLEDDELKTAKALFELADINIKELLEANEYEDFRAELEATQAIISNELFKYWGSNKNLEIIFDIDKIKGTESRQVKTANGQMANVDHISIVEHVLDIRVKNRRTGVSLPLKNRSKGFNWFFSFLVWFKKIQEDTSNNYILLLDEPGLNLHASAQNNLLDFLADLSENYQIIYTTHSPFMIEPNDLNKVRTVLETDNGSIVSDSIQEKDPNTLFPLQAALGYDIAQNLFISKYNLLVEGASDLLYLQVMSTILQAEGRTGLDPKITIVPTGGLDKVSTFISLLRGSELEIVCLLDTFTDAKGKAKLEDMVKHKIISKKKIRFFDEFLEDYSTADIEDIFDKPDYLKIYNEAFGSSIKLEELNDKIKPTLIQLNSYLNIKGFNHYAPANKLASKGIDASFFSSVTLDNFEKIFIEINSLFTKN